LRALWWCAADPGSRETPESATIPDQRRTTFVLHRIREMLS
jgi:hypothetical protein